MKLAKEFIKFSIKELNLKSLPKNIKFEGDEYSAQHLTFGTYNPSTDEVVVVKGKRHPIDVLRTLAHELVHHKQREDGKSLDGSDGSDIENEANAKAGEMLRKFRSVHPTIFATTKQKEKEEVVREIASTGTSATVDGKLIDSFTANLLVTVMGNLNEDSRGMFCNEPINKMVAIAYKMVTR